MFFPYLMSKWTYLKYFEIFKMAAIWADVDEYLMRIITPLMCNEFNVSLIYDL